MHRSTLWLHNLVENLLCASSIQMGRFQVDPQPTSLQDVLDEAIAFVVPLLDKKGQSLKRVYPLHMGEVMADTQRISQVLINLLHNASKYAPSRDEVELCVVDQGSKYRISISEHGPGIPVSEHQHLFERFYRRRPSKGEGKPGVGLGLAIVRSIVELHGGQVGVDSVVGQGSTFWFSLPKPSASDLDGMDEHGPLDRAAPAEEARS
jgi:signal transduction histidine kinase